MLLVSDGVGVTFRLVVYEDMLLGFGRSTAEVENDEEAGRVVVASLATGVCGGDSRMLWRLVWLLPPLGGDRIVGVPDIVEVVVSDMDRVGMGIS